jgi:tRNA nucleotidyltransferase (CCA-adding enzyme)
MNQSLACAFGGRIRGMEIFLVGGAVRDELLGRTAEERDWVVVGSRPDDLLDAGYRPVGRDFPVFLHPETGEEYALARTERKTAPGYRGFEVHASPEVSLEEDLLRRDLTINAMARAGDGRLIDPHGGQRDLEARVLRHVSPAFVEDPVRILRTARFAAEFRDAGFQVAEETLDLMRQMVAAGEADALVPERVWQETRRAMGTPHPEAFIEVLRDCGALAVVFPEIEALFGVPQPPRWHPEIDTGVHTLMALALAAGLSDQPRVRFAVLVHDLGKGTTPAEVLPGHAGHEERGVTIIRDLAARLRIPNDWRDLAMVVSRYHCLSHRALELRPGTIVKLLEGTDALRRPERFDEFLLACEADLRGRKGFADRAYPQAAYLRTALAAARQVDAAALAKSREDPATIGETIRAARCEAVASVSRRQKPE